MSEIESENQSKQELAEELLAAYIRGEIGESDILSLMNQSITTTSDQGRSGYRRRLREMLGPDDPIVSAFDALVEAGRRKKIGDATQADYLTNARPISPEWAEKIREGQRRSHESGKRKPKSKKHG